MLELKTPDVSDARWIYELAAQSNLHSADYSFSSIYCWRGHFSPMVARIGDRLILRNCIKGNYTYAYPIGSGDIMPAVMAMREDSKALGSKFTMRGITADVLDEVKGLFSEEPVIATNRDFSDYVYSAEKLATLSGKKYHSKKNHVNRFNAEHDWRFEPITKENIGYCHTMASEWFINISDERDTDYLAEIRAMHDGFDIYFDVGFDGGIIWENDEVAAFTFGELVSPDTFVTHFEKASPHINGAYTIINQQFAEYLVGKYPDLKYINREEDMGIENLRKAKESYHPEFLVDKYTAVWSNE